MLKSIQAYFPTESDEEAVRTSLISYETEMMEVSSLGDIEEGHSDANQSADNSVFAAMGNGGNKSGHKSMKYVLSTKVKEEDYEAIMEVIHQGHGEL